MGNPYSNGPTLTDRLPFRQAATVPSEVLFVPGAAAAVLPFVPRCPAAGDRVAAWDAAADEAPDGRLGFFESIVEKS